MAIYATKIRSLCRYDLQNYVLMFFYNKYYIVTLLVIAGPMSNVFWRGTNIQTKQIYNYLFLRWNNVCNWKRIHFTTNYRLQVWRLVIGDKFSTKWNVFSQIIFQFWIIILEDFITIMYAEAYLEPSRTSAMEIFSKNSSRLKALSRMFDWVLNTPLVWLSKKQWLSSFAWKVIVYLFKAKGWNFLKWKTMWR